MTMDSYLHAGVLLPATQAVTDGRPGTRPDPEPAEAWLLSYSSHAILHHLQQLATAYGKQLRICTDLLQPSRITAAVAISQH